jgi:hypothetical protein
MLLTNVIAVWQDIWCVYSVARGNLTPKSLPLRMGTARFATKSNTHKHTLSLSLSLPPTHPSFPPSRKTSQLTL